MDSIGLDSVLSMYYKNGSNNEVAETIYGYIYTLYESKTYEPKIIDFVREILTVDKLLYNNESITKICNSYITGYNRSRKDNNLKCKSFLYRMFTERCGM